MKHEPELQRELERLRDQWAENYGLKECDGRPCAHTLRGERCPSGDVWGLHSVCAMPWSSHVSLWALAGKPVVLVSQPYKVDVVELGAWAIHWVLKVHVYSEPAWHYPGRVLQIEVMSPQTQSLLKRRPYFNLAEARRLISGQD